MSRRILGCLITLGCLIIILLVGGCSDSPEPQARPALISGTVTDADGNPLRDAAILVGYEPSYRSSPRTASVSAPGTIPKGQVLQLKILDPCGNLVRMVCDGSESCDESLLWDGRDDAGRLVRTGPYFHHLLVRDEEHPEKPREYENLLLVVTRGWDAATHAPANAVTDADGRFSFTDACLGLGETYLVTDREGGDPTEHEIVRTIDLKAVLPDGRRETVESVFVPEHGEVDVPIRFPE